MKKVFTLMAIFATLVFAASCGKDNTNDKDKPNKEKPEPEQPKLPTITIDGNFDDWAGLDSKYFVSAKTNENAPWTAVKEIRVYATEDFVFYYIKFNKEDLDDLLSNNEELPIRLCINTDGEFESGYGSYFLEHYDFIIEGPLGDGEGHFGEYDGTLHQRLETGWSALLEPNNNLVMGKGAGAEYEILLAREVFNNAIAGSTSPNSPIGDIFHTGIRFYGPGWDELCNMPNASIDEGDGNGWGHLLEVATNK